MILHSLIHKQVKPIKNRMDHYTKIARFAAEICYNDLPDLFQAARSKFDIAGCYNNFPWHTYNHLSGDIPTPFI